MIPQPRPLIEVFADIPDFRGIETVLEQIVLTGRGLTMDALLTHRQVAQTIVDKGGTTS